MDVAIVGAGPAGAWAAYRLARAGAQVTIFDSSHPREKPCGGGVTRRALEIVAAGVELDRRHLSPIRSARFLAASTGTPSADHGVVALGDGALVVASRAVLDEAIFDAAARAGASVARARVTDVAVERDGVRLRTTRAVHRADFVIGADGANSLVRRRVVRPFGRDQLSIATGFYARGATSDEIVIEFVADPPGYLWSFPRPDHLAVGICAQADAGFSAADLRSRAAAWIGSTGIARGVARLEPYAWPIPSLSAADLETAPLAGERWCLTGDAAGLVDPITREGISFAIRSGDWAAAALASADPARGYVARVFDGAIPELSRAARVKARFFQPPFIGSLLRALRQSAGIRAVVADLIAGDQQYRTLTWRLLGTFEAGLAWDAWRNIPPAP